MNRILRLFSFLALTFLIFSCQQDQVGIEDVALDYIPKEISLLTAVNMDQLMQKADFEAVKQMDFYQKALSEVKKDHVAFAKILEDPSQSGVDLSQNAYAAQEIDAKDLDNSFVAMLFPLADVKAFQQMLSDIEMEFVPVSQGYGYLAPGSETMMVWNEEVAIIGLSKNGQDIKSKLESYIQFKGEESVAENYNLQKLLSTDFDIANWMKSDILAEREDLLAMSIFTDIDESTLKGNYLHNYLHFEKGQIRGESFFFVKKKITNDIELFFRKKVEADFTAALPGEGLGMMMTAALSPKGINQVLVEKHVKGSVDSKLKSFGISIEDLIKGLTGDVAIGLYSNERKQDQDVVVVAKIDRKDQIQSLLETIAQKQIIAANGEGRYTIKGYDQYTEVDTGSLKLRIDLDGEIVLKDDLLYLTNSPEKAATIQAGNFSTQSPVVQSIQPLINSNIFSMIMDAKTLARAEKDFKDMGLNGLQATANAEKAEGIIRFDDQSQNSLKTILQLLNKKYLEDQSKRGKETSI